MLNLLFKQQFIELFVIGQADDTTEHRPIYLLRKFDMIQIPSYAKGVYRMRSIYRMP